MRVGVIGGTGSDLFADNIGDALTRMGHEVVYFGPTHSTGGGRVKRELRELAGRGLPTLDERVQSRLVRRVLDQECAAIITTDWRLSPGAVTTLRRNGVEVALWFPDHVASMGRQRMLAAPYTAMFFKDPLLVRRAARLLGLPAWYLPEACNPRWHRPVGEAGTERAIVVIGNMYISRALLLRRLHDAGIPLVVYGGTPQRGTAGLLPPGLHRGRPVFREEKSHAFRSAAAVLNNLHPAEMESVNCRLFEATAAGGAVLCEWRPVLPDLYDVDREVVPFRSFAELVEQARALLDDPGLTGEIGDAAAKRAHADHTYENRLPVILEKLS